MYFLGNKKPNNLVLEVFTMVGRFLNDQLN